MDSSDTSDNPLLAAPTATPSTGTTTTNNNSSPAATTGGKSSNRNHNYNHSHNNNNNNFFNNTCKGGVGSNNSSTTTTNVHAGGEGGGGNTGGEKIGGKRKDRKDAASSVFEQSDRSLYDEDIIDGFAILSFLTYEDCERETIRQERLRKRDDVDENIKSEAPIVSEKAKKARKPRASKVLRTDPADDNGGSLENVNATNTTTTTTTSMPVAVKEEKTTDNCTGQPGGVSVPVPAATAVLKPSVHQNNARPEDATMPAVQPTSTEVTAALTGSENPLLPHRMPSSPSSLKSPPACKPVDVNAASLAAVSGRDIRRASPLQGALGSVPSQRGPWSAAATCAPLNATPPLHTVAGMTESGSSAPNSPSAVTLPPATHSPTPTNVPTSTTISPTTTSTRVPIATSTSLTTSTTILTPTSIAATNITATSDLVPPPTVSSPITESLPSAASSCSSNSSNCSMSSNATVVSSGPTAESTGPPTASALHRNGFPPSPSKKLSSSYPESSSPTLLAPAATRDDVPVLKNPLSPAACSTQGTTPTANITSTAAASISAKLTSSAAAAAPTSMSTSTPPSVPVLTSAHLAGVHRPPSAPGQELQQGHVNASLSSLSQLSQSLQPTGKAVAVSGPTPLLDARVHFPPSPFVGLATNPVPPIPAANQLAASSTAASGGTTHTTNTLTSLVFPKTWSNCPSPAAAIPSSTAGRAGVVESAAHPSLALSSAATPLATVSSTTTTTTTTTTATSNATKAVPQQMGFTPGAPPAAPASGLYPNAPGLGLNPPGAAKLGGPFPDQLLQPSKHSIQPNADLLRRELDARFIASQDRSIAIPPPPYMRGDLGHPSQTPLPPPFLHLVPGQAPPASLFDPKYAAKLDPVAALKYPGTLPGLAPGAPGFPPHVGPPLMSHANTPTSTTPFTSINPTSSMNLAAKMQSFQKSKSNKTGKWCAMHVRIAWEIYNHQQKNGQATSQLSNAPSVASKGFIQGPPPSQGRSSSSSDHTPKQEVTLKNRPSSSTGSLGPSPSSTPTTRELPGVFPNLMPPSAHGLPRHPSGPPNTSPAAISGGNSAYPPYPYLSNLALPPGLPTSVNQRTSSVITSSTSMKHHAQPQHGTLPASPKVSQSSPFTSTSRGFPPTTPFPGAPPFGAMPPPPPHGLGFPGQPGGSSMLQGREALQMDPYRPPMDQYRLGLRPLGPYGPLGHHTPAPGLGLPPGMVQGWGGLKAEAEKEDRERKEKEHLESQKKAHEEIKQRERDRVYQLQREQHQQQQIQQQQQQQIQQQQLHQHHQQQFHQQQQQLHHHHQQQLHQQQQQQIHQQQQQQQHLHQQHQQQQQQQQQLHQQQQQHLHQQQLHHHLQQQQQQQHMIQQHAQAQQQAQQQPQHVLHMMDGILRNGDARHLQNRTPMKNGHPEKMAPRERETRVKEEPEQQQGSHKGSAKPADDLAMRLNAAASGSTGALMGGPHGLGVSMWPTAPPISADYYRAIMMLAPPPGSERFRAEDMEKISPYEREYDRSKLLSGMAGPPNPSFIPPPGAHPGFLPGLGAPPQGIPGLRHKLGVSGPGLPGVPMGVGAGAGVPPPLIPSAPGAPAGHMHKLSSMMPDKPMR